MQAYRYATRMQDLSVVVRYVGIGKSSMPGAARAGREAEGSQVRGAALSEIAAANRTTAPASRPGRCTARCSSGIRGARR